MRRVTAGCNADNRAHLHLTSTGSADREGIRLTGHNDICWQVFDL